MGLSFPALQLSCQGPSNLSSELSDEIGFRSIRRAEQTALALQESTRERLALDCNLIDTTWPNPEVRIRVFGAPHGGEAHVEPLS
jgi:hypothetical protein